MKILVATNNQHKIEEICAILKEFKDNLIFLTGFEHLPKPVEDGNSYYQNSLKKALHYHRLTGFPTLADDSGLEIDAFNGEPGIYSSRYIEPDMPFAERNKIILERMKDIPIEKRGARFYCCCVLVLDENNILAEHGCLEGKIGFEQKGSHGFGYDPVFLLPHKQLHLAEIPEEEKNIISHRANAFAKMKERLCTLFSGVNS
jgi:XTP/dITP diphosphohydrolase